MARKTPTYRPVSITIWDDIRFHSLSGDAKLLWLFFLTSSECPIPGIVIAGESTVAERLGWPVERVRSTFAELVTKRLNVLWEGRVIWCVNGLKHQPIAGPNAMKSMATAFRNVPEVSFRWTLWRSLRDACRGWSGLFEQLFDEPTRVVAPATAPTQQIALPILSSTNPSTPLTPSTGSTPSLHNPWVQEQEQDQDLEQEVLDLSSSSSEQSGGGDVDPARPAPKLQVVRDPEALAEYERIKAAGGWSFPPKGGAA